MIGWCVLVDSAFAPSCFVLQWAWEWLAGAMLAAMEKQAGRRGNKMLPQLDDLGITKMQSSRWQRFNLR
jgi:hypothetical protein